MGVGVFVHWKKFWQTNARAVQNELSAEEGHTNSQQKLTYAKVLSIFLKFLFPLFLFKF